MRHFQTFEASAICWAAFMAEAPRFGGRKNRPTGAQAAGIRYERFAQNYMQELFPVHYIASPWLAFRLKREPMLRYCQPDGLIIEPEKSRITIVEIKLRHCAEAFIQISGIYSPVLQYIFPPPWSLRKVEVTRWYDKAVAFPVPIQLLSDVSLVPAGRFGVHIWNP